MKTVEHGENLIRQGKFEEAITVLQEILREDPTHLPALLTIGIAFTESNRNHEALKALDFYIRSNDANDLAWEAVGCAHLRMGNHTPAREALERALEINPQNAGVLRNLSILMSRVGEHRQAYTLLKQSYELNNEDYLTAYALACAYRQLRKTEKALPLFETLRERKGLPEDIRDDVAMQCIELGLGWG